MWNRCFDFAVIEDDIETSPDMAINQLAEVLVA